MLKAGHATFAVKGEGKSYAIDALASTCAASLSATLEACDLATMQACTSSAPPEAMQCVIMHSNTTGKCQGA